jgi:hypothetical protein
MKQHQDAETGWYAGPYADEVYYCAEDGTWHTSFTRREDTQYDMIRLVPDVEDPRIAAIRALHREYGFGHGAASICAEDEQVWPCATARALDGTS